MKHYHSMVDGLNDGVTFIAKIAIGNSSRSIDRNIAMLKAQ